MHTGNHADMYTLGTDCKKNLMDNHDYHGQQSLKTACT